MAQLINHFSKIFSQLIDKNMKTKAFLTSNLYQRRHRKPLYFRKYREPSFEKKAMLAVCEPVMSRDRRIDSERCLNLKEKPPKVIHPYDRLLAQDMKQELSSSRMICFYHLNEVKNREKNEIKNMFEHENMFLRYYNPDIAHLVMDNTKYESALHLCCQDPDFTVLFSPQPQVSKLLKLNKKCPQLVLLAAIIDDRFLSVDDLKEYSRLPDLHTLQSQLSHTLSLAAKSVADKTIDPIRQLTTNLDIYVRDQQK